MFHTFWPHIIDRIQQHLQQCRVDAAHAVVLLPFAQLMPVAQRQWAQQFPASLVPQFETSWSWAQRLRPFSAGDNDLAFDTGRDWLTAQRLLQQAGLAQQAPWLANRVREAALQLAPVAAAQAPAHRMRWAQRMQADLQKPHAAPALQYEQAIATLAVVWAGHSAYATDALFDAIDAGEPQALLLVPGLQDDLLARQLLAHAQAVRPQTTCLLEWRQALFHADSFQAEPAQVALVAPLATPPAQLPAARLHVTQDPEDEAQCAAACVQRAVQQEQGLVALVDNDRALTRRISALLAGQQLAVRDETGWKLSTTLAASHLMLLLRACLPQASSDAVLAWLKLLTNPVQAAARTADADTPNAPNVLTAADVQAIEIHLRRQERAQWPQHDAGTAHWQNWSHPAAAKALQVNVWRSALQYPRTLPDWLDAIRHTLQATGQWQVLQHDKAGQTLLQVLHWQPGAEPWPATVAWPLETFMHWVAQVLEAASFIPDYPLQEQVAIVPPSQLLARPFAAVIMPGCDEKRLPAVPTPPGLWTRTQRALLGLPDLAQLQQAQRHVWQYVLTFVELDIITSASDGMVELLPSPLLLEWQLHPDDTLRAIALAADPRVLRTVPEQAQPAPLPRASGLTVQTISASSYGNLRACPYRFFALNMLGLREVRELNAAVDKRDLGNWVHRALHLFHQELARTAPDTGTLPAPSALAEQLDACARQAQRELGLGTAELLPFSSVWPQMRDGYLRWLLQDLAQSNAQFAAGETRRQRELAELLAEQPPDAHTHTQWPPYAVAITGTIDRMDRLPAAVGDTPEAPVWRLIDYKTESLDKTRKRIRSDGEDSQLLFYVALMAPEPVQALYLNLGEDGRTTPCAQADANALAPQLLRTLADELGRIAQGAPLPALGEGRACDYCPARGLCRRDFRASPRQAAVQTQAAPSTNLAADA